MKQVPPVVNMVPETPEFRRERAKLAARRVEWAVLMGLLATTPLSLAFGTISMKYMDTGGPLSPADFGTDFVLGLLGVVVFTLVTIIDYHRSGRNRI